METLSLHIMIYVREDNGTKWPSGSPINNLSYYIGKHMLSNQERRELVEVCVCMWSHIYTPGLAEVPMCQVYI